MSKIEETIKILLFSNKRKDLLLMLKDGARSIDELRDELEISMPNLIPHLKILENAKLIWRKKKNVHLTERGLLCVEALINFLNSIEIINNYEEFWKNHDINGIPEPFLMKIHELGNCEILEYSSASVYEPFRKFSKYLLGIKELKRVSPVFHPQCYQIFTDMVRKGKKVQIILPEEVISEIRGGNRKIIERFIAQKNAQLMICRYPVRVGLTLTETFLSLGLFLRDGHFDVYRELLSFDESAIKWGRDLFEFYRKHSVLYDY